MTKPTLSRVLLTVSTFALLGVGFTLSSKKYSVDPQNPTYLAFEQKLSDDLKQGLDDVFDQGAAQKFVLSGGGYSFPSIPKLVDASTKQAEEKADENLNERWNQEVSDLEKVHAPIPYEKLHARALEILRERSAQLPVVAKDEEKPNPEVCATYDVIENVKEICQEDQEASGQ